jgi:hypothetical protein
MRSRTFRMSRLLRLAEAMKSRQMIGRMGALCCADQKLLNAEIAEVAKKNEANRI